MKLVIGGSGGIGRGLLGAWSGQTRFGTYYQNQPKDETDADIHWLPCDLHQPDWAERLSVALDVNQLDTLVLATGLLHRDNQKPEKSIRQFKRDWFLESMLINASAFAELADMLQGKLQRQSELKLAVISAKVGSISDNRLGGWHSYRASKAALNMLVTNVALEWKHRLPAATVVALHPGTTDSRLSAPFQQGLPKGQLHSIEQTGQALGSILEGLSSAQTGQFIAWDGSLLPW